MTEIKYNGEPCEEIQFHQNGELMWIRFIVRKLDGKRDVQDTYVFKGSV